MASEGAPWHAAYPKPKNADPEAISREEVLRRLNRGNQPDRDFLLVDLRRNDHEVRCRTICGLRVRMIGFLTSNM